MSGALALALAAAAADAQTQAFLEPPLAHAISIDVPSLDGGRGAQVGYEHWLPEHRLSLAGTVQLRESAIGDYRGVRAGIGGELRWYWRGHAWWTHQPAGSMVGWFVGGRLDVAGDWTHDLVDHRWLGTELSIGTTAGVGYRVVPWRGLAITPTAGVGVRHDLDLSGRLSGWTRPTIALGLELAWLF